VSLFIIALPNKGALAAPAQLLARALGFENSGRDRGYYSASPCGKYRFLLARARDIPTYVESGVADIGITGSDMVAEKGSEVVTLLPLPFGFCRLVYAVPKGGCGKPGRVATAFPRLAAKFLSENGIDAKVIQLDGAIEASVSAGIADAIIDLSSTGRTLAANGLEESQELLRSSAVIVANPASLAQKRGQVDGAVGAFRGDFSVLRGRLDGISAGDRKRILYRNFSKAAEARVFAAEVFDTVSKGRDEALSSYTERFDKVKLLPRQFAVTAEETKEAYSKVKPEVIAALKKAAENVARFSQKELPQKWEMKMEGGLGGKLVVPLDSVGVYAPGGSAAYPSSVIMGVVPAKVAGVRDIVLCTPPDREGKCNPAVLVAADVAGVGKVFKLGGAQAIAAMALGTRTVPRVRKIVGPGNSYVAAAKLEALSRALVSIDSPAGPSELLAIADRTADARFLAAEMLAQAEHSPDAAAVLLAVSKELADEVEAEVSRQMLLLPRREIIRTSLSANGAILVVGDVGEAIDFSNEYAPEHLLLAVDRPFTVLDKVRNAGAIFIGNYTSVSAGDYAAGPNHVLPTGGAARMYSGLSARDFVREVNYLKLERNGLSELAGTIEVLARAEGLEAHANSVKKRFEDKGMN